MNTLHEIRPSASNNESNQDNCLINLLDQATDRKWSFTVEDHLVINGEVIVLGKLACDDIFRVAFGGCPSEGPGPLHEKLQAASMDSLVRCGVLMGIVQDQQKPQPCHKPDNGNGSQEKARITTRAGHVPEASGTTHGMAAATSHMRRLRIWALRKRVLRRPNRSSR